MKSDKLGKTYNDGQDVVREGELGNCLFVILEGRAEVVSARNGGLVRLAVLEEGEFFGEMALFDHEKRSATVRSMGQSRILTIDKRTFMSRVHEDPSLAFRIVETMSRRIRELDAEVSRLRAACAT